MQQSVIYQDILQKGLQQGRQEGLQQGLQQGEVTLILRLISRRFGAIEPPLEGRIRALSTTQLEELVEALLDFTSRTDLTNYLANIPQQPNNEN